MPLQILHICFVESLLFSSLNLTLLIIKISERNRMIAPREFESLNPCIWLDKLDIDSIMKSVENLKEFTIVTLKKLDKSKS
tara:strand:+ start:1592 stop:1834 length:243 start_codon:yes stop_codon:yes gene_type:complete